MFISPTENEFVDVFAQTHDGLLPRAAEVALRRVACSVGLYRNLCQNPAVGM